jgi:hypothetical protein
MKTWKTATLCLVSLLAAAQASAFEPGASPRRRRSSEPPQRIDQFRLVNAECPVSVQEECPGRCRGSGTGGGSCRWPEFGCDFQICWGTRHHTILGELTAALGDPASYATSGPAPIYGGINYVQLIRLVQGPSGLYLLNGQFVLELSNLSRAAEARRILQNAQACARHALENQSNILEFSESRAQSRQVFRITCAGEPRRAYAQRVEGLTQEAPPVAQVQPPPQPQPPTGGGGVKPPPPPEPQQPSRIDQIRRMDDRALRDFARGTGHIQVDGRRIYVDGIIPFGRTTDPERQHEALSRLNDEERVALKELEHRNSQEAIQEAARAHPPGPGETYVYDSETGEARLERIPPPMPKDEVDQQGI